MTVVLEYLDRALFICSCILFYNSLNFDAIVFFPLGGALYDGYLIIIAIFIWFLLVVCLIEAGTHDFLLRENRSRNFY